MKKFAFLIFLAFFTFLQGTAAESRDYPFTNFTINFFKGLQLGKVSFNYIGCVRAINTTLISAYEMFPAYKENDVDGLLNSITTIISQLFDLNSTCQVSVYEISRALHQYMVNFKDDDYIKAVLKGLIPNLQAWLDQTRKFKKCAYWGWSGCAGLALGRFINVVFNATPKSKEYISMQQIDFDDVKGALKKYSKKSDKNGEFYRMILNAVINFLQASHLLSPRNASDSCKDSSRSFYDTMLIVVDVLADDSSNWRDAVYLFLEALKNTNTIYRECKNVVFEFIETGGEYMTTLLNVITLLKHIIFRSRGAVSRGYSAYLNFDKKAYEVLGSDLGDLAAIILSAD